ncbi:UMP-CMP kinase 2, mitochondrial-like [Schistocerca cancellata]|uniref:UMP-CMP kinase 2, mitochondrial-like n=1 Tax=Schistocerca cancellata TaxID=274614 RepID=UPI0021178C4E|nr:UMP-CMP kinase 2, mitochondrial-like [Schistocerca cancellata]
MANAEIDAKKIKHLYRSLDSTLSVLRKEEFATLQEVKDLLSTFDTCYQRSKKTDSYQNKTFIVLEGLDGSGKTTIAKKLATALNGVRCKTPPTVLQTLRAKFDTHPPILRRAYYSLGNYVAAKEIEETLKYSSVILDRFYHSTAVFTIATDMYEAGLGKDGLPPHGDPVYQWPQDLKPIPDVIFYLDVKEHVRSQRLSKRIQITAEEEQMASSTEFRALLKETYLRMAEPAVTVINSNQPVKLVVSDILDFMRAKMMI